MSTRVVDLTQPLGPSAVLWPGSPQVRARTLTTLESEGYFTRLLTTPEHAGTHLDAPSHFASGGAHVDAIPANRLVAACAVLDVSEQCRSNPDFALERSQVEELERAEGPIASGAAVLIATGWDAFREEPFRYLGGTTAEDVRFPGLAPSGAELLLERGVVGIGIDTLSVDPGRARDFPVHHLTLPAGLWHLEGLVNLAALPPRGATLFVGALRLVEGSGAPARVLAVVPE
jgi:kynurenine formamidase